ncbi:MAG: hypothetical protein KBC05_04115 [Candidatus Hydrogenedentes bacterium]|nr:hypothetical protein [Candidatus Hydrogenedentota bacterium]
MLSLPSGPGSIEGLGESFQPQLNNGTGSYRVPLMVPPGRAQFAPGLALSYDGGHGNGAFGMGWKLEFPHIRRKTDKGLPFYTEWPQEDGVDNDRDGSTDEYDEFDVFDYATGEELVPTSQGFWRCERESGFERFERDGDGWLMRDASGGLHRFGTSAASRIHDGAGRVFAWYVDEITDANGNAIRFVYEKLDGTRQIYCARVEYNHCAAGCMAVVFEYEERPDVISDFRPGFEVRTAFRCREIETRERENRVRSYRLAYAPASDLQPLSLLASITHVGRDSQSTLPPASFTYTQFSGSGAAAREAQGLAGVDLNDPNVDLMDLNADGLPDFLDTNGNPHSYYLNRGLDSSGNPRWSAATAMSAGINLYLGSSDVKVADINGDARTDLLNLFGGNDIEYYTVNESMNWQRMGTMNRGEGFWFSDPDVQLLDLNNDNRIDVMQTAETSFFSWMSLESGVWSGACTAESPNALLRFSSPNTKIADMNGDCLQDLVYIENQVCYYYPGMGYGAFGPQVWMENAPDGVFDPGRVLMADVNGDGRSDVVYVGTGITAWVNLGLDPAQSSRGRFAAQPLSVATSLVDPWTPFRQADLNGNGSADVVWRTPSGAIAYLDFATGEQPYQLKTMSNGIGRTTTVTYRSSTEDMTRDADAGRPWPHKIPFPVSVVGKIEVNDGLNSYFTEYSYHDGYYDRSELEFRGFAGAEQHDIGDPSIPDLITASVFDTGSEDEAMKGALLAAEARTLDGRVFYHQENTWALKDLLAGPPGDTRKVTYRYVAETENNIIEQGNGDPVQVRQTVESVFDVDAPGGVLGVLERTVATDWGRSDVGEPLWDDERVQETVYSAAYPDGKARWVLRGPVVTTLTDENGVRASQSLNYYDGNTTLGALSKGNLTRTDNWVAGDQFVSALRQDFDEYGNVVASYDPLYGAEPGHYREFVYDATFHVFPVEERIFTERNDITLAVRATYDPGWGGVLSYTDPSGGTSQVDYDAFGRVVAITRPGETMPGREYAYVVAQPISGGRMINWVESRYRDGTDGNTLDRRTYFDGLSRSVMVRAESEMPGEVIVSGTVQFNMRGLPARKYLPYFENGTLEYADPAYNTPYASVFYDAMSRVVRAVQPDGTFASVDFEPLVVTSYDEEQSNPASPHAGCKTRYLLDGLAQIRTVQVFVTLTDTGQNGPLTPWTTTYGYDLQGNVTQSTDPQGNRKFVVYDGLGRTTRIMDPDRGDTAHTYDAASNLISTIDARGRTVRYTYDGANRRLGVYFSMETAEPDVEYHYDSPAGPLDRGPLWQDQSAALVDALVGGDVQVDSRYDFNSDGKADVADVVHYEPGPREPVLAANTLGKLAWVRDESGETHFSYDVQNRIVWTMKRIWRGDPPRLVNFLNVNDYDMLDRITRLTYPDGSFADFEYNPRGLLERIPGVVDNIDYSATDDERLIAYACGVTTTTDYDVRLRRSRIRTVRAGDGRSLWDESYVRNGVSMITACADARASQDFQALADDLGLALNEARRFSSEVSYSYDSGYRLVRAVSPGVFGTVAFRYDRIGNMLTQEAQLAAGESLDVLGEMSYGGTRGAWNRFSGDGDPASPAGPHALTSSATGPGGHGLSLEYDQNGNVRSMRGMTLNWDVRDLLASVESGAGNAVYRYDHTGSRVLRTVEARAGVPAEETCYISANCELRDGVLNKYVSLGGSRVARTRKAGDAEGRFQPESFFVSNHVKSINLTLSADGTVCEARAYYPFGQTRAHKAQSRAAGYPYTFAGKEHDDETGMHYFGARYYDSLTGRFVSTDPAFKAIGMPSLEWTPRSNPYAYCANDPIGYTDFSGRVEGNAELQYQKNKFKWLTTADAFGDLGEGSAGGAGIMSGAGGPAVVFAVDSAAGGFYRFAKCSLPNAAGMWFYGDDITDAETFEQIKQDYEDCIRYTSLSRITGEGAKAVARQLGATKEGAEFIGLVARTGVDITSLAVDLRDLFNSWKQLQQMGTYSNALLKEIARTKDPSAIADYTKTLQGLYKEMDTLRFMFQANGLYSMLDNGNTTIQNAVQLGKPIPVAEPAETNVTTLPEITVDVTTGESTGW